METLNDATPVTRLKCTSCGELWDEGENTSPLYECGDCGERFTRNNADYSTHRCSCGKFASKVADEGCDDCNEECEEVEALECDDCQFITDDRDEMEEHLKEERESIDAEIVAVTETQQP